MKSNSSTIEQYLIELPEERKLPMNTLRNIIKNNIPEGFEEVLSYGMIGYVVPHSVYPNGYHCNPKLPLPFINIGSQKNFIVLHHLGIYGSSEILDWFITEYPKHAKHKLDMGKGCVRFKKINEIPFLLIEELIKKISLEKYIAQYEANIKKKNY
jgi:uncharacterized protein YdhG (YjbR/CyaY superfamily)